MGKCVPKLKIMAELKSLAVCIYLSLLRSKSYALAENACHANTPHTHISTLSSCEAHPSAVGLVILKLNSHRGAR